MRNQNVAADKLRKLIHSGQFLPMPCGRGTLLIPSMGKCLPV